MIESVKDLRAIFPEFEPALLDSIMECCAMKEIPAGTVIMRAGQFIRSTVLVLEGLIKSVPHR